MELKQRKLELGKFVYACLWHKYDNMMHYSDRFKNLFKPGWRKEIKESDYMKEIEVNNGCKIILVNKSQCIEIIHCDSYGGIEYSYNIPDGDLVMLLNYYRNCKSGREKSDYIPEGKIRNTNTDIVEYI